MNKSKETNELANELMDIASSKGILFQDMLAAINLLVEDYKLHANEDQDDEFACIRFNINEAIDGLNKIKS